MSDWGSGLSRAQKVAAAIRKELIDPKAENRDKHAFTWETSTTQDGPRVRK